MNRTGLDGRRPLKVGLTNTERCVARQRTARSGGAVIAFRTPAITFRSNARDLVIRGDGTGGRSTAVDLPTGLPGTGTGQVSVQTSNLCLTLCLLLIGKTVGKPTQPLVHIADQQNSRYAQQHDDEQAHRSGETA